MPSFDPKQALIDIRHGAVTLGPCRHLAALTGDGDGVRFVVAHSLDDAVWHSAGRSSQAKP